MSLDVNFRASLKKTALKDLAGSLDEGRCKPLCSLTSPQATIFRHVRRRIREANVPTEPQKAIENARLPHPDAHSGRPEHACPPAPKGPASSDPGMNAGRRPHSFPKTYRLLRRNEFRRVYEEGRRRSAPLCTVFFRSNGLALSRLGVTVPRAVGNAVLRNRVKRRVREVFRLNRESIAVGWDMVVNPRKEAATVPFVKLTRELMRLFPASPPPGPETTVPEVAPPASGGNGS